MAWVLAKHDWDLKPNALSVCQANLRTQMLGISGDGEQGLRRGP